MLGVLAGDSRVVHGADGCRARGPLVTRAERILAAADALVAADEALASATKAWMRGSAAPNEYELHCRYDEAKTRARAAQDAVLAAARSKGDDHG